MKINLIRAIGALIVLITSLALAESILWRTARDSYPRGLVSETPIMADTPNTLDALRRVCAEPLEIVRGKDGTTLVRCGIFWPFREIWVMPGNVIGSALTKSLIN